MATIIITEVDRIEVNSMEFRPRDYVAEAKSHALPRSRATHDPLSSLQTTTTTNNNNNKRKQLLQRPKEDDNNGDHFCDPLRGGDESADVADLFNDRSRSGTGASRSRRSGGSSTAAQLVPSREWSSFKRFLMQKFPVSKMISISSMSSDVIIKGGVNAADKSSKSIHLEELDDLQKSSDKDTKVVTQQEYVSRLLELKDEITRAWHAEDRVAALKLSIKVAKLLMDTPVLHFYPTLFVLVTEVMDMLGDLVWNRIRQRAEFSEDGTLLCKLSENFVASDICSEAKETCYNWFCKVGSIRELLPRIYLELAILPCCRFLRDQPADCLQRLVTMIRGLADPLASAYCRLYMAHCSRKLPLSGRGHLVTCIKDINTLLKDSPHVELSEKKRNLLSLMEPTIEYIVRCIFEDAPQKMDVDVILEEIGLVGNQANLVEASPCASIILHYLLKELPIGVVCSSAVDILHLIKSSRDYSFDQCLNYRLLGIRLAASRYPLISVDSLVDDVIQVVSYFSRLDEYTKVADAYMDIILQNKMNKYLDTILEGISVRACNREIVDDESESLQSILVKILSHLKNLEDALALDHFFEILDSMSGTSKSSVDMHILNVGTSNGYVYNPVTIQFLFEISQSLYDGIDFTIVKDDDSQQPTRLISHFVRMVDYGEEMECHLKFLVECRAAFGGVNELKETLVHSSNCLVIKAVKNDKPRINFIKSCIAFSEVTIPSIRSHLRQFNLYLETTEVALLAGLVSHSDGLLASALICLENIHTAEGFRFPFEADGILSSIRKLCGLLVMVPGSIDQGTAKIPKSILSLIYSQSWMTQLIKTRTFCAVVLLLATLSQNKLPYHTHNSEVLGNDILFFADASYMNELVSLAASALQNLVNSVEQEPSKAARGSIALEACNCIASSFKANKEVLEVCWKLIDTARLCMSANDKYLKSTIKYLDEQMAASRIQASSVT